MEVFFADYGLFLAKLITGLLLSVVALAAVLSLSRRGDAREELKVELEEHYAKYYREPALTLSFQGTSYPAR